MASAAWNRRNAKARSLGYRNAYDYRIHRYGEIPPSEPGVAGEERSRYRGHRSAADLERAVGPGDIVSVWTYGPRDSEGKYKWVDMLLVTSDGKERIYRLRGRQITASRLTDLVDHIDNAGAVVSPSPSLDIHRLIGDVANVEDE